MEHGAHDPETGGPLDGILVLAVTHMIAGAFATSMLADLGAEVIRIERPGGRTGPEAHRGPSGSAFDGLNRNKQSMIVDLGSREGATVFRRMAKLADVVVENLRPGAMAAMGLGSAELCRRNSRLVYCSISGFGATGPLSSRGGFDLVAQAMSGLMSLTGERGGAPVKVGVPIADFSAGLMAAYGVVAALFERHASGRGQFVDISLLDSALSYAAAEASLYLNDGLVSKPTGTAHRLAAPYQAFETADGWVVIGAATDDLWRRACAALDLATLGEHPRWRHAAARLKDAEELAELLAPSFRALSTDDALDRLQRHAVPCGPLLTIDAALQHPQIRAREMVVEPPGGAGSRVLGTPVKLSRTPGRIRSRPPRHGEHTAELLARFGRTDPPDVPSGKEL